MYDLWATVQLLYVKLHYLLHQEYTSKISHYTLCHKKKNSGKKVHTGYVIVSNVESLYTNTSHDRGLEDLACYL